MRRLVCACVVRKPQKTSFLASRPIYSPLLFLLQDGNTFCTTLQPRLFTIDLSIGEHSVYFSEVINFYSANKGYSRKKKHLGGGGGGGGGERHFLFYPTTHGIQLPPTPTTHVIRKFRTPTTHRIQFS